MDNELVTGGDQEDGDEERIIPSDKESVSETGSEWRK